MTDYPILNDADNFKPYGDRILITWEEKTDYVLGGKLVRPDTYKAAHYTGTILKIGPDVMEEELKPGKRVFFEQFSSPVGLLHDKTNKRLALIRESDCLAIIPARVKVGAAEAGINYDA